MSEYPKILTRVNISKNPFFISDNCHISADLKVTYVTYVDDLGRICRGSQGFIWFWSGYLPIVLDGALVVSR